MKNILKKVSMFLMCVCLMSSKAFAGMSSFLSSNGGNTSSIAQSVSDVGSSVYTTVKATTIIGIIAVIIVILAIVLVVMKNSKKK